MEEMLIYTVFYYKIDQRCIWKTDTVFYYKIDQRCIWKTVYLDMLIHLVIVMI